MKKGLFVAILTAMLLVAVVACTSSPKISVTGVNGYNGATINKTEKTIKFETGTDVDSFKLSDIKVSSGTTVKAYSDTERKTELNSISLNYGENIFYLILSLDDKSENWTLTITRADNTGSVEGVSYISVKALESFYYTGEEFKPGILQIFYADDTVVETEITSTMVKGFSTATAGQKTITVEHLGKSVNFVINVLTSSAVPAEIDEDVCNEAIAFIFSKIETSSNLSYEDILEMIQTGDTSYFGDAFKIIKEIIAASGMTTQDITALRKIVSDEVNVVTDIVESIAAYNGEGDLISAQNVSDIFRIYDKLKAQLTPAKAGYIYTAYLTYFYIHNNPFDFRDGIAAAEAQGLTAIKAALEKQQAATENNYFSHIMPILGTKEIAVFANDAYRIIDIVKSKNHQKIAALINNSVLSNTLNAENLNLLNEIFADISKLSLSEFSYEYIGKVIDLALDPSGVSFNISAKEVPELLNDISKIVEILKNAGADNMTELQSFLSEIIYSGNYQDLDCAKAITNIRLLSKVIVDISELDLSDATVKYIAKIIPMAFGYRFTNITSVFDRKLALVLSDNLIVLSKFLDAVDASSLEAIIELMYSDTDQHYPLIVHFAKIAKTAFDSLSQAQLNSFIADVNKVFDLTFDEYFDLLDAINKVNVIAEFNPDNLTEGNKAEIDAFLELSNEIGLLDFQSYYYTDLKSNTVLVKKGTSQAALQAILEENYYFYAGGYYDLTECVVSGYNSSTVGYKTMKLTIDGIYIIDVSYYVYDASSLNEFVILKMDSYYSDYAGSYEIGSESAETSLYWYMYMYNTRYGFTASFQSVGENSYEIIGFNSATAGTKTGFIRVDNDFFGTYYFPVKYNIYDNENPVLTDWWYSSNFSYILQNTEPDIFGEICFEYNYGYGSREYIEITADMVSGFSSAVPGITSFTVTVEYKGQMYTTQVGVRIITEAEGWELDDIGGSYEEYVVGQNVNVNDIELYCYFRNRQNDGYYTIGELKAKLAEVGSTTQITVYGSINTEFEHYDYLEIEIKRADYTSWRTINYYVRAAETE